MMRGEVREVTLTFKNSTSLAVSELYASRRRDREDLLPVAQSKGYNLLEPGVHMPARLRGPVRR